MGLEFSSGFYLYTRPFFPYMQDHFIYLYAGPMNIEIPLGLFVLYTRPFHIDSHLNNVT